MADCSQQLADYFPRLRPALIIRFGSNHLAPARSTEVALNGLQQMAAGHLAHDLDAVNSAVGMPFQNRIKPRRGIEIDLESQFAFAVLEKPDQRGQLKSLSVT